MTLARLIEGGTSEERRLLRAARCDGPSARMRADLLLSVGLGTSPGAAAAADRAAIEVGKSTSNAALGGTTTAGAVGHAGIAVLVKWVGIAGVALMVGLGAGFLAGSSLVSDATPIAARAESSLAKVPKRTAVASAASPEPAREILANTVATLPLPPPRVPPPQSVKSSEHGLSEEVRLIDLSRSALRTGDATRCLRLLDERRQRFPNGALGPEAALLRIEALSSSGQQTAAEQEGTRFLVQQPTGPLAGKVRTLLGRKAGGVAPNPDLEVESM